MHEDQAAGRRSARPGAPRFRGGAPPGPGLHAAAPARRRPAFRHPSQAQGRRVMKMQAKTSPPMQGKAAHPVRDPEVRDLMTEHVFTLRPNDDLETLYDLMDTRHVRHVPIVDHDGDLVGLVTQRDLARSALGTQDVLPLSVQQEILRRRKVREIMATEVETVEPDERLKAAAEMLHREQDRLPAGGRRGAPRGDPHRVGLRAPLRGEGLTCARACGFLLASRMGRCGSRRFATAGVETIDPVLTASTQRMGHRARSRRRSRSRSFPTKASTGSSTCARSRSSTTDLRRARHATRA